MSNIAYVFFDKDKGTVLGVGNTPNEKLSYIEVDGTLVTTLLSGAEPMHNYAVEYNPKTKELEFVSKFQHVLDAFTVNEFIYEIPQSQIEDPDISIIQDIPDLCWKVKVGEGLKKNLRAKGVSLTTGIMLSITAKGDPNILYKTMFVDFNQLVNDNYFILPFTMPFEKTQEPVSIYTARRFDTYQFTRIYEQD